jgi:hypothetical protein
MESPESKDNHCMILLMVQQSGSSPNDGHRIGDPLQSQLLSHCLATSIGRKKEEDQAHRYSIRSSAECSIASSQYL